MMRFHLRNYFFTNQNYLEIAQQVYQALYFSN